MFRPGVLSICAFMLGVAGRVLPWRIFNLSLRDGTIVPIDHCGATRYDAT